MTKRLIVAMTLVLVAMTASAQQMPPGKWWRNPRIVNVLGLSEEQQSKLDAVFRSAASELIDLRGALEKQNIALRGELDQPQLNRKNIQQIAARLNDARGRLFERELVMLVDMRTVLSDPQWNRFRTILENLEENQRQQRQMRQDGQGPNRPGPNRPGPNRQGPNRKRP